MLALVRGIMLVRYWRVEYPARMGTAQCMGVIILQSIVISIFIFARQNTRNMA